MTLTGSHFSPKNVDLVNILRQRIEREQPCRFIITDMQNLYEKEPWLLQHVSHVGCRKNEWIYFTRTKKRHSQKVADKSGRWKTTSTWTEIKNKDGVVVGYVKHFSFKAKSETEKDGIKTGWVMHEFVLDKPVQGFQDLVLCRIRFCDRGEDNAQYAPRLTPRIIGLDREDGVVATAPVETHLAQGMEQHQDFGSSGQQQHNHMGGHMEQYGQGIGDMVESYGQQHQDIGSYGQQHQDIGSYSQQHQDFASHGQQHQDIGSYGRQHQDFGSYGQQHQDIGSYGQQHQDIGSYGQQHQDIGSYGQQHDHNIGLMEQYGQGFGDMVEYQNQFLGQQENQILGQQATYVSLMEDHQKQHQNIFGGHGTDPSHSAQAMVEQQQWNGYDQGISILGESSGQQENHILGPQATYVTLMEDHQNLSWGHGTDPSHSAQAMVEQQQWNGYFGPHSSQPYVQGIMEPQDFDSSALGLAQNDQYLGQNNELPTVPMETQQQHDNVIRNTTAQPQLVEQENVHWRKQQVIDFLMNEDFNEVHGGIVGSPTDNEVIYKEIESDVANFGNEEWAQQLGKNTPEEEAELHAKCETFESFLNFFCATN